MSVNGRRGVSATGPCLRSSGRRPSVIGREAPLRRHEGEARGGGSGKGAPLLSADGVSKDFSGVRVLDNVDLALQQGEVHALMGENGAGKSTLVKILSGIHTDYEGTIRVDGAPLSLGGVRDAELAGIAMIHQELNLVPELSVAENIFLGREPLLFGLLVDRRRMTEAARALLARLGIALDPEMRVGRLRVGEQQLVEIAK